MNLSDYGPQPRRTTRMSRRVLRGFEPDAFANVRKGRNLSVADLARLADISTAAIFNWEAGKATPTVDLLARAMKALGTPIEDVVRVPVDQRYPGDWRVANGITQPQLAAKAGIATTTLRGIERADAGLSPANAAKLAAALNITVEQYRAAYQRARSRPPGTTA